MMNNIDVNSGNQTAMIVVNVAFSSTAILLLLTIYVYALPACAMLLLIILLS